ncbi:hypothetical protein DK419_27105 [Methylobacterium terrae]|uniref:DUF1902 domain-containing protein n=1 Tax=Methylobacterium terrae TaxID=2202827 RepID=A0A2U8WTE0_9HYPH|nr:hypothetical protein [Methylobacterium terrae]AWN49554.1 hypothetical protein DK419_27105 [Methylobacterium terrae]
MTDLRLLCFAKGRPGLWEAVCVDLDIAVQAETQDEVLALMRTSIDAYLHSLEAEEPAVRERLLRRRAPWHVRTRLLLGFMWHTLTRRSRDDYRASYELPCHA